jgi:hypothetical protein
MSLPKVMSDLRDIARREPGLGCKGRVAPSIIPRNIVTRRLRAASNGIYQPVTCVNPSVSFYKH